MIEESREIYNSLLFRELPERVLVQSEKYFRKHGSGFVTGLARCEKYFKFSLRIPEIYLAHDELGPTITNNHDPQVRGFGYKY